MDDSLPLFSVLFKLKGPNVTSCTLGAGDAPLVGIGTSIVITGVYGRAALQQRMSKGGAAVVLERSKEGVGVGEVTCSIEVARSVTI